MPGARAGWQAGRPGKLAAKHPAHAPDQNRYVASHALRICPAQSLPVSRTGTGCFFFLKNVLPAGVKSPGRQGRSAALQAGANRAAHAGDGQEYRAARAVRSYQTQLSSF